MVTIHSRPCALSEGRLDHVPGEFEHIAKLSSFQAIEIAQHVVFGPEMLGSPYPNAASVEVRPPAVLHNRPKAVVAGGAAADLESYRPVGKIQLIVDGEDIGQGNLEEPHRRLHGLAAQVHVGHRLEKDHVVPSQVDLHELALELVPETRRTPAPRQSVEHHEADVVAIASVL